ncbi:MULTISPECIES: LysR family transcriptional regulator [Mangrovibacter]|nr:MULTISPECIES: LysR family transcriptional regulator [Mangrovibacter]PWW08125.1 LysR family transcriptional regulator [Mangrovibacter plantisponsor]
MTIDLHELDAFEAVARHRSFRKAAAERGVSASALSHALRGLEERLGVRLLHRTTRSVTPTEAGHRLLARLAPALRDVADALSDVTALQAVPTGTLRLNVPRPAAWLVLSAILPGFVAKYPRVKVDVVTDDGLVDIVDDGFDAGIRFGESLAGDMVAVPVGPSQRFVCIAAPSYLNAYNAPNIPTDLLNHACICRRFPGGHYYNWEFLVAGKPQSIAVSGPLVFDDDMLMVQAARDGAGIAYLYEAMVREDLAEGRLVSLLEAFSTPPGRFFLYYSGRRHLPTALRAFVDFIRK